MEKQRKHIFSKIIFFIVFSLFIYNPFIIEAKTTVTIGDLYSNPNQGPLSDYSFNLENIINANLLTQVVGCTGVIDKVSEWMAVLPTKLVSKLKDETKDALYTQLQSACSSLKATAEGTAGTTPGPNDLVSTIKTLFSKITGKIGGETTDICSEKTIAKADWKDYNIAQKELLETQKAAIVEQCFNGIAITLAKNQLTAMTKSTMNWVNKGFGGNPFYVQNISGLMRRLETNVIETGIDSLLSPGKTSPYAENFVSTTINSKTIGESSTEMLGGLYSTLGNFITDPVSYYEDEVFEEAEETDMTLIEAERANEVFSNNFSSGGWDAWMALTQVPQNNPLGYTMLASQIIADESQKQQEEMENELIQNNGFLSQKKCILWQLFDADGKRQTEKVETGTTGLATMSKPKTTNVQPTAKMGQDGYGECIDWETITPGSLIKDKVSNYITSPERQLELAKTINDGLNALFSVLLEKLQTNGLPSLSYSSTETSNWVDDLNSGESSSSYSYSNGGSYNNFNLTEDLGNTYYHLKQDEMEYLGTWDASENIATNANENKTTEKLYLNKAPQYALEENGSGEKVNGKVYMYYIVTTPGKTKIIENGYSGWEEGDRAFWDGEEWQNWKCGSTDRDGLDANGKVIICPTQKNPLEKRGVVQTQKDFLVAAKDLISFLPKVTTSLAELDYCIPGPNPNYKLNSNEIMSNYQDWVASMYIGPRDEWRTEWKIDHEDSRTYKNFANNFKDTPKVFEEILGLDTYSKFGISSNFMWLLDNFDRQWESPIKGYCFSMDLGTANDNKKNAYAFLSKNCDSYEYTADKKGNSDDLANLDNREGVKNLWLDYVNSSLFDNFFEVFDKMMDVKYFNNITKEYFEHENTSEKEKNGEYMEMAEMGLSYVRNLTYYDNINNKTIEEYENAIFETQTNIAKLESIKGEVSKIIKEAQDTRNKKLEANAQAEGLTLAKYLEKYASCLEEENISFFDIDDIIVSTGTREERCKDGIDNDLDRLVDGKDPDCSSNTSINTSINNQNGNNPSQRDINNKNGASY